MLKIYGYPNTRSLRATWMAEELGLDYEYCLVDMMQGDAKKPDYLAVNPAGKVPAIECDGAFITESLAIINFMAALKPDVELVPLSSHFRRAYYDQWASFALTELEQPLWTMGKNKFALPKEKRCPEIMATAQWEFQQALQLLSEGLGEHAYILGEHFTAADILVAHTLFWGMAFKQPIEQENLKAYIGRNGVRPALAAARSREQSAKA
ncbi:MAG: glutathione S-transferase family protein [Oleiphilaceae bacterium]|nr:glutathione S-transferase family protein [Oleiphilaceae bacterium]